MLTLKPIPAHWPAAIAMELFGNFAAFLAFVDRHWGLA
jgi:hypothetical protein